MELSRSALLAAALLARAARLEVGGTDWYCWLRVRTRRVATETRTRRPATDLKHTVFTQNFSPEGVRGDHASVFSDRATPCSTHSDVCSSVAKLASKTKPTPMAFRRSCVT